MIKIQTKGVDNRKNIERSEGVRIKGRRDASRDNQIGYEKLGSDKFMRQVRYKNTSFYNEGMEQQSKRANREETLEEGAFWGLGKLPVLRSKHLLFQLSQYVLHGVFSFPVSQHSKPFRLHHSSL